MDPFYVGNVSNFQLNGMSNINEIRMLENQYMNLISRNFQTQLLILLGNFQLKKYVLYYNYFN